MNYFCGFLLHSSPYSGFNLLQACTMYVLGYWLKIDSISSFISAKQSSYLYLLFTAITIALLILSLFVEKGFFFFIKYSSPFIISAAVCFFLFFTRLHFTNAVVNSVASTVVAMLFIQDVIFKDEIYGLIQRLYHISSGLKITAICSLLFVAIMVSAFVLEKLRRMVAIPLERRIVSAIPGKYQLPFS